MSKLHFIGLVAIFLLGTVMQSCQKENDLINPGLDMKPASGSNNAASGVANNNSNANPCGGTVVDFFAGQNVGVGTVTIENTSTDLLISVTTTGGWVMGHTHLYVGDIAGMPATGNGNPQIGQFPYSDAHNPMTTTFSWTIPLADLDECFAVALHAEVHLLDADGNIIQSETAWGNGNQINNGGSWATYIDYCVEDCCENPITTEAYDIFGGQTIPVGELQVTNDADYLYISWSMDACWSLEETHLYVGDAANIPTNNANTPIPGQFPYQAAHTAGTSTYTYTIPLANLPACYVIAAHASTVENCSSGGNQQETAWSFGTEFPNSNRWGWYSDYCTQEGCN